MRKFLKIFAMLAIALVAFCSLVACRNNAGGGGTNTEPPAYTPLPAGTDGTAGISATYVEFGRWSQTIKGDSVTVDKNTSEKKDVGMFTYYKGDDDNWYCEAQENAYGTEYQYKYSNDNQVKQESENSYQWFKVEPIKWRVLTNNYNGKKLLFAESGLYANVPYYDNINDRTISGETIYPNNYKHSRIRAWLNGLDFQLGDAPNSDHNGKGFLQTAFTAEEQEKISMTIVDNSAEGTTGTLWNGGINDYACGNTTDKIFLLSAKEVTTRGYVFAECNGLGVDSARIRKPTDFALANYALCTDGDSGWYVLRSPTFKNGERTHLVSDYGDCHYIYKVSRADGVVVPTLCVD